MTDTGCGIPRGSEEIIFERFRQLSSQDQGCGLGLYISRLIARLLNGDVEVDTSYREGTASFSVFRSTKPTACFSEI